MNAQYTHVSNTNRARRLLASMAHSRLKDMREELMPGGDLRLLVRVDRLMPARQRAALRKCTVHDLLTGLVRIKPPADHPCLQHRFRRRRRPRAAAGSACVPRCCTW